MDVSEPDGRGGPHVFVDDLLEPRLGPSDHHHLANVLRVREGDAITIGDGAGRWRSATFRADPWAVPACEGEVIEVPSPTRQVTVGFSLIKGGRPELVVQKLTELGVDRIVPLAADRSVVRWDDTKTAANLDRFRRVAREAAMQSRRVRLPDLDAILRPVDVPVSPSVVLAELGGGPLSDDIEVLLVGPEGGWTASELEDRRTVGLGSTILRAETAAISGASLLVALRDRRLSSGV